MKKFTAVLLFLSIFLLPGMARTDELHESFSGIKWGAEPSKILNLTAVSRGESTVYYHRPHEVYRVQEIDVSPVIYGFYRNRFFAAFLTIRSTRDFDHIKKYLTAIYGAPRAQLRMKQTIYIWSEQEIKIKMKLNDKGPDHKLAFYYTPLAEELNTHLQEKDFETAVKLK